MIKKYVYGAPFDTEAVVQDIPVADGLPIYGSVSIENGFVFQYQLAPEDIIYGLGENVRGINKRGFEYISNTMDNSKHFEDTRSLYAAHNFLVVWGQISFGIFIDYPATLHFDIGYSKTNELKIFCDRADLSLYLITGNTPEDIIRQFRRIIGRSYIAPKYALGFGQSRWGYKTPEDFRKVVQEHREKHIPIDMVYMDIDYMDGYRDFTINKESFPNFSAFVQEMKDQNIRLIPIIDAGVKIDRPEDKEKSGWVKYPFYEEGVEKNFFCKRQDGTDFIANVWPGETHFPDVLNKEAREWFGNGYSFLLDQGIEGFWNDMNEPSIFYTPEGLEELRIFLEEYLAAPERVPFFFLSSKIGTLSNSTADYQRFFHNVDGKMICHADVHNLYGYNMTRAAGEAFERLCPEKRILLFSRSSYVGMHRYGGIWTGDNFSWWSHLLMNLKMLPSLNMMGLLYVGADCGGFGSDTTRDLLLRWLALCVFTPLMRNHSAMGTRRQEFYQFEEVEDFQSVMSARYRLIPYLYSEYVKAALRDEMMFRPLAFLYSEDALAVETEDQLLLGNEIMIAPVVTQNASGRYVYLPEEMMLVKFLPSEQFFVETLSAGIHYIKVALGEVPLFIRRGKAIPIADTAEYVEAIDYNTLKMIGYDGASYELYNDDGFSKNYEDPSNYTILHK